MVFCNLQVTSWIEVLLICLKLAFGHDHLGHGLSDGKRGVVSSLDVYVKDVFIHVSKAKVSKGLFLRAVTMFK